MTIAHYYVLPMWMSLIVLACLGTIGLGVALVVIAIDRRNRK